MRKVYAFIDSQNLNLGVKSQGWSLDFSKFRVFLKEKYNVSKAFLFIGYLKNHVQLYASLKKSGYFLIYKPVVVSKTRYVKGNVDAELVLHSMIEFPNYNKAVIVSGDGDFYCLVKYLVNKKKLAKIIAPNKKYSSLLRRFAQYIVNISLFKDKLRQ